VLRSFSIFLENFLEKKWSAAIHFSGNFQEKRPPSQQPSSVFPENFARKTENSARKKILA